MVIFAVWRGEVFEAIRARDDRAQLPFKLDGADVGGFSVKLQFNQEERSEQKRSRSRHLLTF